MKKKLKNKFTLIKYVLYLKYKIKQIKHPVNPPLRISPLEREKVGRQPKPARYGTTLIIPRSVKVSTR